ncbi:uncharacterized protein LOC118198161 [Stegodyphus dumicola]|uniref:uncharacterized protein LOC118198161 n=1 Tax=Stegodyphus dumicola TaxID=202533 RepID=UPI0015B2D796|nr:uncharacterized protein LOC118198161 [Stegodyphus dumicola]
MTTLASRLSQRSNARRAESPARSDEDFTKYKALDVSSDSDGEPKGDRTRRTRKPAKKAVAPLAAATAPEIPKTHPVADLTPQQNMDTDPPQCRHLQPIRTLRSTVREKLPPIIIKDSRFTWNDLKTLFNNKNFSLHDFYGENMKDGIKIKVKLPTIYREMVKVLEEEGIRYHCYALPESKHIKAVIRNLPSYMDPEEIMMDLKEHGLDVVRVNQLTIRRNGEVIKLPLFLVTLTRKEKNKEIHQLKFVLGMKISVERYRGRKGPLQCYRCQGFHHAQSHCNHEPRCVRCGEPHESFNCDKDKATPPKCANCHEIGHTANYRLCVRFPKPKTTPAVKTFSDRVVHNKTYAQALNTGLAPEFLTEAKQVAAELRMLVSALKKKLDLL